MSNIAVTKKEIFEAADALADLGIMPSIMTVRDAVGNKGSESTIIKHLREWKALLLSKNNSGCVFCESAKKEIAELQNAIISYKSLTSQLRQNITGINPEPCKDELTETLQ